MRLIIESAEQKEEIKKKSIDDLNYLFGKTNVSDSIEFLDLLFEKSVFGTDSDIDEDLRNALSLISRLKDIAKNLRICYDYEKEQKK